MLKINLLIVIFIYLLIFDVQAYGPVKDSKINELINKINVIKQEYNIPAVGLVIIKKNKLQWLGSLGIADRINNTPADENTFYRVGSITKAFTSLAILKLKEQGEIDLNDPLRRYVSNKYFNNKWRSDTAITIAHLLEHTAGFSDINTAEFDHDDPTPIAITDGLAYNAKYHITHWPPGLHKAYSNLGSGLIGAAIENITNTTFDDYLKNELLIPLHMPHSSTLLTDYVKSKLAKGYDDSGINESTYWHLILRPFGALNSSPKEMERFLSMLINRGKLYEEYLFSPQSINRMETPTTTLAAKAGLTFGYGLGNYQTEHNGLLFHGHGGTAAGYLSRFDYLLENQSGYVLMINANNQSALNEISNVIKNFLTSGLIKEIIPDLPLPSTIDDFTGYYQPVAARGRISLILERLLAIQYLSVEKHGVVLSSLNRSTKHLKYKGNNTYSENDLQIANTVLIKLNDGEIYLQNDKSYQKISSFKFFSQTIILVLTLLLIIYSPIYVVFLLIKQLYLRKLPTNTQSFKIFKIVPFLLIITFFGLIIILEPRMGDNTDIIFKIVALLIISSSFLSLVLALWLRANFHIKCRRICITILSVIMAVYLYNGSIISQPIWS
jgi:CubicO group peptidase (beta-lactamase class C family)